MTKLDQNNIQTGSLTAQSLSPSISIGGGSSGYVHANISSVEITDSSFNPAPTVAQISSPGTGYIKVTGRGFNPSSIFSLSKASTGILNAVINSAPYFGGSGRSYEIGEIAIPAVNTNIVSSTEARLTITNLPKNSYNLFMVSAEGKIALKRDSVSSNTPKTYGYIVSGTTVRSLQPPYSTKMDRFSLANETSYLANRAVYTPASWASGTVQNGQYGYILGGQNPGNHSNLRRINFASDTTQIVARHALWSAVFGPSGFRNLAGAQDATHGYFFGGYRNSPAFPNSAILRLTFANDSTTASPYTTQYPVNGLWITNVSTWGLAPAPLSATTCGVMGTAQNRNHVWMNARTNQTTPAPFAQTDRIVSNIFRFTFTNNLNQLLPRGYFTQQMDGPSGFSTEDYGYWIGQNFVVGGTATTAYVTYGRSNIQRLQFSNDTAGTLDRNTDPYGIAHNFSTHCQMSDPNYAWFTGGETGSPSVIRSGILRMSFASDTSAVSDRGSLSSNRLGHSNFSY